MYMEENIILQIKSKLNDLSKTEKKIGEYITQHAMDTVKYNTSELAEKAGVSPATIVRFCRSIGLSGFSQLKIRLYADVSNFDEDLYTDITPNENMRLILDKLALRFNHSITQTSNQLDTNCIEQISEIMDTCTTIYVYGLGASHIAAEDFTQKFSRIGKSVINTLDHHLLSSSLTNASDHYLFIAISNSGETNEVTKLAQIAKQKNCYTVGLTQNKNSTLANLVDLPVIHSGGEAVMLRSAATTSIVSQLFAIDVLYYTYINKHAKKTLNMLKKSKINIQSFFS